MKNHVIFFKKKNYINDNNIFCYFLALAYKVLKLEHLYITKTYLKTNFDPLKPHFV